MYEHLEKKFEKIGASVDIVNRELNSGFRMDVRGNTFILGTPKGSELQVLDIDEKAKHLLLFARDSDGEKSKFLAGFDEREFFISGVKRNSINIDAAKQGLKPAGVVESQKKHKVKKKNRHKRKNEGFLRQGEWYFVPVDDLKVEEWLILKNEPLMLANARAGSNPHIAEEAYRSGGTQVYIPNVGFTELNKAMEATSFTREQFNAGLRGAERTKLINKYRAASSWGWRPMMRNPLLYVRGKIRHGNFKNPEHKPTILRGWHRVELNDEVRSAAVVFLD